MLVLLLQWLLISGIGIAFGKIIIKLFAKASAPSTTIKDSTLLTFLCGLSVVHFIGNAWSLVMPIGLVFQGLLVLVTLFTYLKSPAKELRLLKPNYVILLPLLLIALLLALHPTSNVDEAGYYLPQVKWLESYPTVRGSALFIARLGFNSALHMLSAIFGYSQVLPGGVYELNGLLFMWFNYYFICAAYRILRSKSKCLLADTLLVSALLFPFSFLIDSIDSDYLVTMGSIVIIAKLLESFKSEAATELEDILIYTILIALLIQTKPFAGLLLFGPLILTWKMKLQLPSKALPFLLLLLFMMPWLIRNVIISGYLVFPAYYLDLFDVSWKVPHEMAKASLDIIGEHAKVQSIRLDYLLAGIEELSLSEWVPTWVAFQKEQMIGWFVLLFLPLSIMAWVVNNVLAHRRAVSTKVELYFLSGALVVLIFWFLNFPAIRFGWPWLLSFIVVNGWLFVQLILPRLSKWLTLALIILASLSWARLSYKVIKQSPQLKAHLLWPPETLVDIDCSTTIINNVEQRTAKDAYCHGISPPCKPHNNPYKIIPMGASVEKGFRIEGK